MKFIKFVFIPLFLFYSHIVQAYVFVCPTVDEIRSDNFSYWLPLYKDGEELASNADVNQFKAHVKRFVNARWDTFYQENGHCFYSGDDPILNKIVFARDAWRPVKSDTWKWVSINAAECYSMNHADCGFIS